MTNYHHSRQSASYNPNPEVDQFTNVYTESENGVQIEQRKGSLGSSIQDPVNDISQLGMDNCEPLNYDSYASKNTNHILYPNNHLINNELHQLNCDQDQINQLTPDQQQAFYELQLMNQALDYDDDYEFGMYYDPGSEYDVREKLESLNAQLATEPSPPDPEYRHSKVVFRDDVVSLVVPADNYDQSESELEDNSFIYNKSDTSLGISISDNTTNPQSLVETATHVQKVTKVGETISQSEGDELNTSELVNNKNSTVSDSSKVNNDMIVSRSGKFQFLTTHDITDESKASLRSKKGRFNHERSNKKSINRPISAPPSRRHFKDSASNFDSGSSTQSDVRVRSSSQLQRQNLRVPRVDKDALLRQQERKKREDEENMKKEEEKQNDRKEINTKSFNTWLQIKQKQKKDDEERKKKDEDDEKERKDKQQEERKYLLQELESELNKKMDHEKKKEEKLRHYRLKEMGDSIIVHTDSECQRAFNDWLKKKHRDHQSKVREEKLNARLTRLAMRQCRKSQNLAQAINQSNSLRYPDY